MAKRISILLVEDTATVRVAVRALLRREPSFELVGEAENGEVGVRMAAELTPCVVLVDVQMPVMNGIEATRRILQTAGTPMMVIALSASTEARQAMLDAGAVAFLAKDRAHELGRLIKNLRGGFPAGGDPTAT